MPHMSRDCAARGLSGVMRSDAITSTSQGFERRTILSPESRNLLDKISERSAKMLLVCILKEINLTKKDCVELSPLIEAMKKQNA